MEKEPDYLLRTPIYAIIQYIPQNNMYLLPKHLPEGYEYVQQMIRFPAGYREKYVINGKDYEIDDEHRPEEVKKLILADLLGEGLNEKEAREFIDEIPTKEGDGWRLGSKESLEWLAKHPEFEKDLEAVMAIAGEGTKKEVEEIDREPKQGEGKSFRR